MKDHRSAVKYLHVVLGCVCVYRFLVSFRCWASVRSLSSLEAALTLRECQLLCDKIQISRISSQLPSKSVVKAKKEKKLCVAEARKVIEGCVDFGRLGDLDGTWFCRRSSLSSNNLKLVLKGKDKAT